MCILTLPAVTKLLTGLVYIFLMCGMLHADAAYRFYRTKCEEDSIKRRGKAAFLAKQKRKHEHLTRVMTMHYCSLQNSLFCCPCIHYYILDVTHVYDFYYYLIIIFLCSNEVLQLFFTCFWQCIYCMSSPW